MSKALDHILQKNASDHFAEASKKIAEFYEKYPAFKKHPLYKSTDEHWKNFRIICDETIEKLNDSQQLAPFQRRLENLRPFPLLRDRRGSPGKGRLGQLLRTKLKRL